MNRLAKLLLLMAVIVCIFQQCVAHGAEPSTICERASPTNPDVATGGMGGTGIFAQGGSGGMGGTGAMASGKPLAPGTGGMGGTGIVGVITGFASVCVNGIEVHYDSQTPVSINGQSAAPRDLSVGQMVVVQAGAVRGQLRARGIGVLDVISGPVTRVNQAAREIQVMGQNVRLDSLVAPFASTLTVDSIVRVSGFRTDNGAIAATRIDAIGSTASASIHGTVSSVDGSSIAVNGTRVTLPNATTAQPPPVGTEIFVAGEWNGKILQARRVDSQPVQAAIARNERAIVEGYVTNQRGNQIHVGGIAAQISSRVQYNGGNERDVIVGRRVQVEMLRNGDTWLADRVILHRPDSVRGNAVSPGSGPSHSTNRDLRPSDEREHKSQDGSKHDGEKGSTNSGNSGQGSGNSGTGGGGNTERSGSSGSHSGSSRAGTSGSSRLDSGGSSRSNRR